MNALSNARDLVKNNKERKEVNTAFLRVMVNSKG
nr:MAG TPA: hypothetical protein [Caudoviricetes sp.]